MMCAVVWHVGNLCCQRSTCDDTHRLRAHMSPPYCLVHRNRYDMRHEPSGDMYVFVDLQMSMMDRQDVCMSSAGVLLTCYKCSCRCFSGVWADRSFPECLYANGWAGRSSPECVYASVGARFHALSASSRHGCLLVSALLIQSS